MRPPPFRARPRGKKLAHLEHRAALEVEVRGALLDALDGRVHGRGGAAHDRHRARSLMFFWGGEEEGRG